MKTLKEREIGNDINGFTIYDNDFPCPIGHGRIDRDFCESLCCGKGCSRIKKCKPYLKQIEKYKLEIEEDKIKEKKKEEDGKE